MDSSDFRLARLSRRRILQGMSAVGISLAGSALLAACSGSAAKSTSAPSGTTGSSATPAAKAPASTGVKKIVFASSYQPQQSFTDWPKVAQKFNASHPGIEVSFSPMGASNGWGDLEQKLTLEAQRKTATFNMIHGPTPFVDAPLASLDLIKPLDGLVQASVFADVYKGVQTEIAYNGKNYFFPYYTDVTGLIYRKSFLKKAGYDGPPATWDDLKSYCAKLQTAYDPKKVSGFGADWEESHRLFLPIFGGYTTTPYTQDGVWNVADPAFVTALQVIKDLHSYMPAGAGDNLSSATSFMSGTLAMEFYWQPQMFRAIQAKQPAADIAMAGMKGTHTNTIFWTACVVIPKYAQYAEECAQFMAEGLLSSFAVASTLGAWKIVPFKSVLQKQGKNLPSWTKPLLPLLDVTTPIPTNPYWLTVEQPVFKPEVDKMILKGQSPKQTQQNIASQVKAGIAKMSK